MTAKTKKILSLCILAVLFFMAFVPILKCSGISGYLGDIDEILDWAGFDEAASMLRRGLSLSDVCEMGKDCIDAIDELTSYFGSYDEMESIKSGIIFFIIMYYVYLGDIILAFVLRALNKPNFSHAWFTAGFWTVIFFISIANSDLLDLLGSVGSVSVVMVGLCLWQGMLWSSCMNAEDFEEASKSEDSDSRTMVDPVSAAQSSVRLPEGVCITGICGKYAGKEFYFTSGRELSIGRGPAVCSIVIDFAYISRHHCDIRFDAAKNKYVIHCYSANGVEVLDKFVIKQGEEREISRGSVIYIANRENGFLLN